MIILRIAKRYDTAGTGGRPHLVRANLLPPGVEAERPPQAGIDKYINEFLDLSKARQTITVARMRGCIDGKPADV